LEKDKTMTELDKLVEQHLTLTNDGKCDDDGHELISRACVHCGLTIHQIAEVNDGVLPMRDTPQERAERKSLLERDLKNAQETVTRIERHLAALESP
jgi:hypothetical protein